MSMSQAYYRKWRPRLWEQVIGQDHVVRTLQNAIKAGQIRHAYLFAGPRGTGKTTTARLLAKAVNCTAMELEKRPCDACEHCTSFNEGRYLDLIEIDAASNTSVDDVRDLREKINFSPGQGDYKIYIIDEVHMLSTAAFNALLKTLEEPPPHAVFILATTEVHKIPATVLSRCQRHEFRRIPVNDIAAYLEKMAAEEKLDVDTTALRLIARQATGSMRDAISLLDQLASSGEKIDLTYAQQVLGTATSQTVVSLVKAILETDTGSGINCIHQALDAGSDPRQFARQVVDYLRGLLLIRLGNPGSVDAPAELLSEMNKQAEAFSLPHLMRTLEGFNNAASEIRSGWQPGLLLEMALAEASIMDPSAGIKQDYTQHEPATKLPARLAGTPVSAVENKTKPVPNPARSGDTAEISPQITAETIPPATPPSGGNFSFQALMEKWTSIRALVKRTSAQTEGLLNSCKPLEIKNGTLILGFASEVLKSKMEMPENMDLTRQAITHHLGVDMPITCVVTNIRTQSGTQALDVQGDGMLGTAINLGGVIKKTKGT